MRCKYLNILYRTRLLSHSQALMSRVYVCVWFSPVFYYCWGICKTILTKFMYGGTEKHDWQQRSQFS